MLFIFPKPERPAFWMKNTLIPLDMIFIDEAGSIIHIHENARPHDLTGISPPSPVVMVLEINGGLARRLGIRVGDVLRHPRLDQSLAKAPCASAGLTGNAEGKTHEEQSNLIDALLAQDGLYPQPTALSDIKEQERARFALNASKEPAEINSSKLDAQQYLITLNTFDETDLPGTTTLAGIDARLASVGADSCPGGKSGLQRSAAGLLIPNDQDAQAILQRLQAHGLMRAPPTRQLVTGDMDIHIDLIDRNEHAGAGSLFEGAPKELGAIELRLHLPPEGKDCAECQTPALFAINLMYNCP